MTANKHERFSLIDFCPKMTASAKLVGTESLLALDGIGCAAAVN
jgi:hypothetical protein